MAIAFGQIEHRNQHIFIQRLESMLADVRFGKLGGFFLIASEQPLIKTFLQRQHRLIAEHDAQERKLRDVAAHYDEADRQRHRQQAGRLRPIARSRRSQPR